MVAVTGGIWFCGATHPGGVLRQWLRTRSRSQSITHLAVAAGGCLVWWIIALQPAFGALNMNWEPSFPIAIGNEIGGARPWMGEIRYVGIYDRALSQPDVQQLIGGDQQVNVSRLRNERGLLVGYDFRPGEEEPQMDGRLKDADLAFVLPPGVLSAATGLAPSRFDVVRTAGSAARIAGAISSSGAFTVETFARPRDLLQTGPARLVSNSFGVARRNFTVGQAGADLVFRVRNKLNGDNGNIHELSAQGAVELRLQQLVATYDHGVSTIFRDGKHCSTVDLREPIFHAGISTGWFGRVALMFLTVITMSCPVLLICDSAFRPMRACVVALSFTAVAGVLPYFISCAVVGGACRIHFAGMFLLVLVATFAASVPFVTNRRLISA